MKNKILKRSHLSEKTCREIIQLFADDLTATQIAAITSVSRVTINNYLKLIRTHIARHCEEQGLAGTHNGHVSVAGPAQRAGAATDEGMYYGFYKQNGHVVTEEIAEMDKQAIRAMQQAALLHREGDLKNLRYQAIADFNDWRLYRVDARNYHDEITVFWGNTRNRLLKFRGMNKNTLYLHVKESEFRFNYRADDINKMLLNIIYQYPLHLSKAYVS